MSTLVWFNSYSFKQRFNGYSRIVDASSSDTTYAVACDLTGAMYFGGLYIGTSGVIKAVNNASVSTNVGTLPASNNNASFVCKFNPAGTYQYTRIIDAIGANDTIYSVTCDSSNNMYVAGSYQYNGTNLPTVIAVNSSNVSSNLANLPPGFNTTTSAAFVSKFDSNGTYQYSRVVDGAGNETGYAVACDSTGAMYFGGRYTQTPNITTASSSNVFSNIATLPLSSGGTAFVCKFNSAGTYQYSRVVESAGDDYIYSIACDSSNNMYAAGTYNGSATIVAVNTSNVATAVGTLPASSNNAAFVSKFNSVGTYQYSRIVDTISTSEIGYSVTCDLNGNMYLGGVYNLSAGSANIVAVNSSNVATVVGTLPGTGSNAAFVCKFNSTGTYQYTRIIDGVNNDSCSSVTCDPTGNVYVGGSYNGSASIVAVNISNVATVVGTLPATNATGAFVCKFDSTGTYQYSRIVDSTLSTNETINSVVCDPTGNVYAGGVYTGTTANIVAVNSSNVSSLLGTLPTSTLQAAFTCKFSSLGEY